MLSCVHQTEVEQERQLSFDELKAKLLAIMCRREMLLGDVNESSKSSSFYMEDTKSTAQLLSLIQLLLKHDDCEHFPFERRALFKMQQYWQAYMFRQQTSGRLH